MLPTSLLCLSKGADILRPRLNVECPRLYLGLVTGKVKKSLAYVSTSFDGWNYCNSEEWAMSSHQSRRSFNQWCHISLTNLVSSDSGRELQLCQLPCCCCRKFQTLCARSWIKKCPGLYLGLVTGNKSNKTPPPEGIVHVHIHIV